MTCRVWRAERERERERGEEGEEEEEEGGALDVLELKDACSVRRQKVDRDSKSMPGSRCRSYDGESLVTFRSNITYAILFFSSAIFSNY